MKFLVLALALVGILAIAFVGILYARVKIFDRLITISAIAPTGATTTVFTSPAATTTFLPPVFHGPTAQPHIKGPTSNPPNY
jgi:hypothetical protein